MFVTTNKNIRLCNKQQSTFSLWEPHISRHILHKKQYYEWRHKDVYCKRNRTKRKACNPLEALNLQRQHPVLVMIVCNISGLQSGTRRPCSGCGGWKQDAGNRRRVAAEVRRIFCTTLLKRNKILYYFWFQGDVLCVRVRPKYYNAWVRILLNDRLCIYINVTAFSAFHYWWVQEY